MPSYSSGWTWKMVIMMACVGLIVGLLFVYRNRQGEDNRQTQHERQQTQEFGTYTNPKYRYQIRYPQDWEKVTPTLEPESVAFSHGAYLGDGKIPFATITVNAASVAPSAIAAWRKTLGSKKFTRTTLAGIEAFETSATTAEGVKRTYEFVRNDQLFTIETVLSDAASTLIEVKAERKTDEEYRRLFHQILASFKFNS